MHRIAPVCASVYQSCLSTHRRDLHSPDSGTLQKQCLNGRIPSSLEQRFVKTQPHYKLHHSVVLNIKFLKMKVWNFLKKMKVWNFQKKWKSENFKIFRKVEKISMCFRKRVNLSEGWKISKENEKRNKNRSTVLKNPYRKNADLYC